MPKLHTHVSHLTFPHTQKAARIFIWVFFSTIWSCLCSSIYILFFWNDTKNRKCRWWCKGKGGDENESQAALSVVLLAIISQSDLLALIFLFLSYTLPLLCRLCGINGRMWAYNSSLIEILCMFWERSFRNRLE